MGTVVSKAANGVGALLGNAFVSPFKTIFGRSCEDICSGTWDITCFIEHLCIGDLVKLLMVFGLCYIIAMFVYLMFEVGICQCIGRSICKMCWAACKAYWMALEGITCFLCHKLKNVKRVNRRHQQHQRHHFQDIEAGHSSSESELSDIDRSSSVIRKRKLVKERRNERSRTSLYPLRHGSKGGCGNQSHHHHHHHHRARLKNREGSARGLKTSRQLQIRKLSKLQRETASFKKRRLK